MDWGLEVKIRFVYEIGAIHKTIRLQVKLNMVTDLLANTPHIDAPGDFQHVIGQSPGKVAIALLLS